jgi:putative transposase
MSLKTVKLTASFKLSGSVSESLFSAYQEMMNELLNYAQTKGITSFKRLKSEKYQEMRRNIPIYHLITFTSLPDGLLYLQKLQKAK